MIEENDINLDEEMIVLDERRYNERSRLVLDLFFNGHDATGVASLYDISLGGLYMKTSEDITVGSAMYLRIPFSENESFIARAEVVYADKGEGVGVKFIDVSDENLKLLESKLAED